MVWGSGKWKASWRLWMGLYLWFRAGNGNMLLPPLRNIKDRFSAAHRASHGVHLLPDRAWTIVSLGSNTSASQ